MSDSLIFKDALALINDANKSLEKTIYIPSLQKEVVVKPLNANHIKNIIKSSVEGPFNELVFSVINYNILKDILDIDLSTINTFDKQAILLQIRSLYVNDNYELTVSNKEKNKKVNISLKEFFKKKKETFIPFETKTIEQKLSDSLSIVIETGIPSIKKDYEFNLQFYTTRIADNELLQVNKLKELMAPLFISRITPFIEKIIIGDKTITLNELTIIEQYTIIEQLPSSIINSLLHLIDSYYGSKIIDITHYTVKDYTGDISIDVNFFLD